MRAMRPQGVLDEVVVAGTVVVVVVDGRVVVDVVVDGRVVVEGVEVVVVGGTVVVVVVGATVVVVVSGTVVVVVSTSTTDRVGSAVAPAGPVVDRRRPTESATPAAVARTA
jgi:hypothetical protein